MSLLKRILVAALFVALGFFALSRATGHLLQIYATSLLGFACFIVATVILAFPLARLMAEPAGGLFYPGRRLDRPLPMYSIPESKRTQGLYEESIAGFERIAEEYPDEVKPYLEMIDISIRNLKDADRARDIFARGMSLLEKEEDRDVLEGMYVAIASRLNAKPSN